MKGRALIDLPAHGLKCGEYGELPKAVAGAYIKAGHFDPKAVQDESDPAPEKSTSGANGDDATGGDAGSASAGAAQNPAAEAGADSSSGSGA